MNKLKEINKILGITDSYKAPAKLLDIVLDEEKLKKIGTEMLNLYDHNLDYDWFHEYFQDEHADRKKKKQDFTPGGVAALLNEITNVENGVIYESATGTGGIIIKHLSRVRFNQEKRYNPLERLYICEELSDRAIPFLLFNLAIRGVNAIVVHCNVLTREAKSFYHVFNKDSDPAAFSDVLEIAAAQGKERMEAITNFKYKIVDELG